jgi:hypothetical protein
MQQIAMAREPAGHPRMTAPIDEDPAQDGRQPAAYFAAVLETLAAAQGPLDRVLYQIRRLGAITSQPLRESQQVRIGGDQRAAEGLFIPIVHRIVPPHLEDEIRQRVLREKGKNIVPGKDSGRLRCRITKKGVPSDDRAKVGFLAGVAVVRDGDERRVRVCQPPVSAADVRATWPVHCWRADHADKL